MSFKHSLKKKGRLALAGLSMSAALFASSCSGFSYKANFAFNDYFTSAVNNTEQLPEFQKNKEDRWTSLETRLISIGQNEVYEDPHHQVFLGFGMEEDIYRKFGKIIDTKDNTSRTVHLTKETSSTEKLSIQFTELQDSYNIELPEQDLDSIKITTRLNVSTGLYEQNVEFEKKSRKIKQSLENQLAKVSGEENSAVFVVPDLDSEFSKLNTNKALKDNVKMVHNESVDNVAVNNAFYYVVLGAKLHNIANFAGFNSIPEAMLSPSVALMQKTGNESQPVSIFYSKYSNYRPRNFWILLRDFGRDVARLVKSPDDKEKEIYGIFESIGQEKGEELLNPFSEEQTQLKKAFNNGIKSSFELNPKKLSKFINQDKPTLEGLEQEAQGTFYPCFEPTDYERVYFFFVRGKPIATVQPLRLNQETYWFVGNNRELEDITKIFKKDTTFNRLSQIKFVPFDYFDKNFPKHSLVHHESSLYPNSKGVITSVVDQGNLIEVDPKELNRANVFNKRNMLSMVYSIVDFAIDKAKKYF